MPRIWSSAGGVGAQGPQGLSGEPGSGVGVSGSQDLDTVCDVGNITDQDLKFSDGYFNFNGPNGDSHAYFFTDESPTGASLWWHEASGMFQFTHDLSLFSKNIVSLADPINVQDAATKNYVDSLSGAGIQDLDDVCDLGSTTDQIITAAALHSNADICVNHNGPEGDSAINFYENGSPSGAYFMWDDAATRFELSGEIIVYGMIRATKNMFLNQDYEPVDVAVYFGISGPSYEQLFWNNASTRFQFSDDLYVEGNFHTEGNMGINVDAGDVDAKLEFYKPSSGNETLKWDKTDTRFEFSDTLSMETHKIVEVVDPTEDQDAATKKYVDDNVGVGGDGSYWHPDLSGKYGESDELAEHPQFAPSGQYVGLSGNYITHRDDTTNPHEVTFSQARDQEGGSDATLLELEELTDGSETTLHSHAGGAEFTGPILIMNAMWLDDDSGAPLTSRLSGTYPALHDGDKTTEAKYQATTKWSIGVDLGVTRDIARLKLFDDPADQNHPADTGSGWGGIYPGGSYDSLEIYTAGVNGAWTLRETVHPVPRLPSAHGRPCAIDIALSGTYSCRFIKAYCHLGQLAAVNGGAIGMAEIECLYD